MDEKVNQLLLINVINKIVVPLNDIVEWDRYGLRDYNGFIFGWIKRDETAYDFVVVNFEIRDNQFFMNYNTSSKKYSKELANKLSISSNVLDDYLECKPASDIPQANLVKWQKKYKELIVMSLISLLFLNIIFSAITGGANIVVPSVPKKSSKYSVIARLDQYKRDLFSRIYSNVLVNLEGRESLAPIA
jgi:hypothetical protein